MKVRQEIMVIMGKKNDPHYRTIIANDGFLKEDDKSTGFGITGYIHEEHACVLAASFDLLEALENISSENYDDDDKKHHLKATIDRIKHCAEEAIRKARGL